MKKFLCYDTNDAASGKIGVDSNGVLKPNSTVPSTNGTPYQQLVTDGDGNAKWENRLAYEVTGWKDFTLSLGDVTEITGFTMPPVGDTVTVKVNGVESVETVKSGEIEGQSCSSIGSIDIAGMDSGAEGWIVINAPNGMLGAANPETTISLFITEQHKIDGKYIQQDKDFVRPLSYYINNSVLFRIYYNKSGEQVATYKCDSIKSPDNNRIFVYDLHGAGIGIFEAWNFKACFTDIYIFTTIETTNGISRTKKIYGTDETAITELAAHYGFTLTTKPTT